MKNLNSSKKSATKKTLIGLVLFTFVLAAAVPVMAKVTTCTIVSVNEKEVVMKCTAPENLTVGDKVRVKPKKKKAIEGC